MEKNILKERIIPRCREVLNASGFSETTIHNYVWDARRLLCYMEETETSHYTSSVGEEYLRVVDATSWKARIKKRAHKFIKRLNAILTTSSGTIKHHGIDFKTFSFPGNIGSAALSFIESKQEQWKKVTTAQYKCHLSHFSVNMNAQGITLESLYRDAIIRHIDSYACQRQRKCTIIKAFLAYAYEQNMVSYEVKSCLDDVHYKGVQRLPSFYSPQEVMKVETSINRSTGVGKRDYAMVLLASRLGLRAGDICALKFSNIDWDRNVIEIEQMKTGKSIVLPLLEDIGNAIIDYVRNGRPATIAKTIFVSHSYPDRSVTTTLLTSRVRYLIKESGVDISGRHAGPHSLRHSLATTLLNDGITLPIISEALGHEFTSSTMLYLNTDISSLIDCSLDVPTVDRKFYNQYGGILYGEN